MIAHGISPERDLHLFLKGMGADEMLQGFGVAIKMVSSENKRYNGNS